MRRNPHLYEINTRVFLSRLSSKYGRKLTLGAVPEAEWLHMARRGFDLVWLMGVWKRSPAARKLALSHPELRRRYREALPDLTDADIDGSPYAVYEYSVDDAVGTDDELAGLKSALNHLGLGLVLDFVPNHVALDHLWARSHPDWFVRGNKASLKAHPDWFYSPDGKVFLAHGKDPYFPPWADTAQGDFFSSELREAQAQEMLRIAALADGVRCDMAMLALNDVFEKIWGKLTKRPRPATEFWTDIIGQVKEKYPGFVFLAEVYWGLEPKLLDLGFDFVYDKVLYDELRFEAPPVILSYLKGKDTRQSGMMRFVENHDEPRAVTVFGRERSLAAGLICTTLPGLHLFHDGQLEGKRTHLPVQLVREPVETPDAEIMQFYDRLLAICNDPVFHDGRWAIAEIGSAWAGNGSNNNLLAWTWQYAGEVRVVVVNYSTYRAQGRIKLPSSFSSNGKVEYRDELHIVSYMADPDELRELGLYVELEPWRCHILHFEES